MAIPPTDRNYRLPGSVRPVRHQAFLSIDPEARTFQGRIRIDLRLTEAADAIPLHAAGLSVTRAAVLAGSERRAARVAVFEASETISVDAGAPLPPGDAAVELEWTGRYGAGLRGLYRAGPLSATQFEAADARRVFPCHDEPGFKAPWAVEVEVPRGMPVLANGAEVRRETRGDRDVVAFAETPPLPTYLLAVVAGALAGSPPGDSRGVPVRTWAVPEKADLTAFGQEAAMAVLPRLEDYFDVPYAFGKLDQVGLPDFEFGAMENAGLVTYRETALLLDPATASLPVRKRIAEVVTHELAHQWVGNWVTMRWWDDLWLNESFATWMAYKVVAGWRPEWRIWLDFDQGKAAALGLDALRSTHPIHAEVRNPEDMGEAFDLITYEKGGAVLRMIEAWLGEEPFRRGIRLYMRRFARGNAVADDLWAALQEASGQPVLDLANAWIRTPGFPVVSLARDGARVRLAQRRFLSEPGAAAQGTWPVPVVLRFADADGVKEQRVLLREASAEVGLEARGEVRWVLGNSGSTGFYRVDHDEAARAALSRHLPALRPEERIGLVADEWALLRAGGREPGPFLDLLAAFAGEEDRAVLDELVGRLAAVEHRILDSDDRARFRSFAASLLRPGLDRCGLDARAGEDGEARLRRAALVRGVALVARDPGVSAALVARLDRFLAGERDALEPNLHEAAVAAAARDGGTERFESLRRLAGEEKDPALLRRYRLGVALFEDPALARRASDLAFGDAVPLQDLAAYVGALLANRAAAGPSWTRLRADWDAFVARLADAPLMLRRVVEGLGAFTTRAQLEEARAFLAAHDLPSARQAVAQTLERLSQDVALWERIGPAVGAWLAAREARR
ncbi:MAG TPA: M1 family metallopeptidase [Anaeromyxobacteraceae bacterium]|nr:M1 family metallopeptidase [Anaeromyxobacteraceae bacterium]